MAGRRDDRHADVDARSALRSRHALISRLRPLRKDAAALAVYLLIAAAYTWPLLWRAGDVLGMVRSGVLTVRIAGVYTLTDVAQAHRDLEARKTLGKYLITMG